MYPTKPWTYRIYYVDGSIEDLEGHDFDEIAEQINRDKLVIKIAIFIKDKVSC